MRQALTIHGRFRKSRPLLVVAICTLLTGTSLGAFSFSARAALPNLVQNSSFAITGGSTSFQFGSGYSSSETLANWSTSGYNFVFVPGTADSAGATGVYGNLKLWGPNDGSANGLPAASPTGGNYIAADGAFQVQPITQTISGLKVGQAVAVSFAWAAAQQYSFDGPTTDLWTVGLGSSPNQSTGIASIPTHGFSGWMNETFYFVATSSSEVLSFLATGTPAGVPPFALLANVSVTNVPEPASVMLMLSGIAGIAGFARRRGPRVSDKAAD